MRERGETREPSDKKNVKSGLLPIQRAGEGYGMANYPNEPLPPKEAEIIKPEDIPPAERPYLIPTPLIMRPREPRS